MQSGSPNPKTIVTYLALIMLSFMLLGVLSSQADLFDVQRSGSSMTALPYFQVSFDGTEYESVSDFQESVADFGKGSVVELHGYLPYMEDFDSYVISFLNYYCGVEVFCGSELIYTYGDPASQKVIGSGYHYVTLPADYYQNEVRIRFAVTVPSSLFSTPTLLFGEWDTLYMYHIRQNLVAFSMDVFMVVLGIVLVAISAVGLFHQRQFLIIMSVGAIALVAGVWTLCNSKFIQLFIFDPDVTIHIEYQCFYLLLLLLIQYFYIIIGKASPLRKKCRLVFILSAAAVAAIELLQFFDIMDYPETLSYFHIIGSCVLIVFAGMSLHKIRSTKRKGTELYLLMALIGLVFFALIDIGIFYYYVSTSLSVSPIVASHYGMMFFVVALLMSVPNYIREFTNERNEKLLFKHLAFSDALTSIGNRARCEDVVKSLIEAKVDFTFVIFDLNNLKQVNDAMGHKAGDALLCGFADALSACFPSSPAICRIGGDEFAVILPYIDKERLKNDMENYEKSLAKKAEEIEYPLSAAYGASGSDETESPSWEEIFRLADGRMYKMKSDMHNSGLCR